MSAASALGWPLGCRELGKEVKPQKWAVIGGGLLLEKEQNAGQDLFFLRNSLSNSQGGTPLKALSSQYSQAACGPEEGGELVSHGTLSTCWIPDYCKPEYHAGCDTTLHSEVSSVLFQCCQPWELSVPCDPCLLPSSHLQQLPKVRRWRGSAEA